MQFLDLLRRKVRNLLLTVRSLIIHWVEPVTDSTEFRALYPLAVVCLGVLAAFQTDSLRTLVLVVILILLVVASSVVIVLDTVKIRLDFSWNILFFSYYRPFLLKLSNRIARSLDRTNKIDILTYRTGNLIGALEEAGADFEQVSGERQVNIASFDIEYIPALRAGVGIGETEYKLIPLTDFWPGRSCYSFIELIPEVVRAKLLQRLDENRLYALPIGWGLVGVSILEHDLTSGDVMKQITVESEKGRGVSFHKLVENIASLEELGYHVLCYDLWTAMVQMVSLNYTGHMEIGDDEVGKVAKGLEELYGALKPENIIADPVLLLSTLKQLDRCIVIGGASWFGTRGTLVPIDAPRFGPTYGGFCECFGLLGRPEQERGREWQPDAARLMEWLARNLSKQTGLQPKAGEPRSIVSNFFPGLIFGDGKNDVNKASRRDVDIWADQSMQIDERAEITFRQFARNGGDPASRWREIWRQSKGS